MNPKDGVKPKIGQLASHAKMEDFLGRYCGLMLFVKEIDYNRYQQICAVSDPDHFSIGLFADRGDWTGVLYVYE